jgi:hypothetical protein
MKPKTHDTLAMTGNSFEADGLFIIMPIKAQKKTE